MVTGDSDRGKPRQAKEGYDEYVVDQFNTQEKVPVTRLPRDFTGQQTRMYI